TGTVLLAMFIVALVQINGAAPRILSIGQPAVNGVALVAVGRDSATLQIDGRRQTLAMGHGNHGTPRPSGSSVTLAADARGHFSTEGQINGAAVHFVVDTGATLVSLSSAEARRLGLEYQRGEPVTMNTANGTVPARKIRLNQVRVGAISLADVEAVVVENLTMPTLLGMSFLNRMDMRREGQLMTLTLRY
ncbi:MAG: TIGR02281 family clan AA aspartic protease, partial [Chloroflexota bacterium]